MQEGLREKATKWRDCTLLLSLCVFDAQLKSLQYTVKVAVAVWPAPSLQTNSNPDSVLSSGPYTNRVPVGVATAPWRFPVFAIGVLLGPTNNSKMGLGPPYKLQVTFKLSPSTPTRLEGITTAVCDEAPQIRREKLKTIRLSAPNIFSHQMQRVFPF